MDEENEIKNKTQKNPAKDIRSIMSKQTVIDRSSDNNESETET